VYPGGHQQHQDDDVEGVAGTLTGRTAAEQVGERDDEGDGEGGAGEVGGGVALPVLAGGEEDGAEDLRAGDHHERHREDGQKVHGRTFRLNCQNRTSLPDPRGKGLEDRSSLIFSCGNATQLVRRGSLRGR
jgi:hypothetical protein